MKTEDELATEAVALSEELAAPLRKFFVKADAEKKLDADDLTIMFGALADVVARTIFATSNHNVVVMNQLLLKHHEMVGMFMKNALALAVLEALKADVSPDVNEGATKH
jgi:hypothetical protein